MPIHFTAKSGAIFKAPNDPLSAILSSISGNVHYLQSDFRRLAGTVQTLGLPIISLVLFLRQF